MERAVASLDARSLAHACEFFGRGWIAGLVTKWKRFTAKETGICWQRDFFDHRLRDDESFDEKAAYIRNNPVRAGLVSDTRDWPWQIELA